MVYAKIVIVCEISLFIDVINKHARNLTSVEFLLNFNCFAKIMWKFWQRNLTRRGITCSENGLT